MNKYTFRLLRLLIFAIVIVIPALRVGELKNAVSAQPMFQLIPVASGLSSPLYVTSARDGSNVNA